MAALPARLGPPRPPRGPAVLATRSASTSAAKTTAMRASSSPERSVAQGCPSGLEPSRGVCEVVREDLLVVETLAALGTGGQVGGRAARTSTAAEIEAGLDDGEVGERVRGDTDVRLSRPHRTIRAVRARASRPMTVTRGGSTTEASPGSTSVRSSR